MVAVSGGGYHSLALMSDRTVWTWGWNLYGQLGDSPAMSITEYAIPTDDCSARDITEGPDGALWFAEVYTKKIGRITTTGSVTEYMVPSIASGPFGITSGPDGALWYTKWFDNMIGRITTAGAINEWHHNRVRYSHY